MISTQPIQVHVRWIPTGHFFLWGAHPRNARAIADALELRMQLFAWHEASFYGTFIEQSEWDGKEGVMLSASQALDFFAAPRPNPLFGCLWGEECESLMRLAPVLKEAIERGELVPDFDSWRQGRIVWKLPNSAFPEYAQPSLPYVQAWIEALWHDRTQPAETLRHSLSRLQDAADWQSEAWPEDLWADEDDWLLTIGWKSDPAPFRAGLRLTEPEDGPAWRLEPILADRTEPELVRLYAPNGASPAEPEPLPQTWSLFLEQTGFNLDDWMARHLRKWRLLLPWLEEAGLTADEAAEPAALRTRITSREAWDFLAEHSLRLSRLGYAVQLPVWWERLKQARPKLRAKLRSSAGPAAEAVFGLHQVVRYDWRLAIDDGTELTEEEFRQIAESQSRLVQVRGRWVSLDPELIARVQQVMKRMSRKKGLSLQEVIELHLLGSAAENGLSPEEEAVPADENGSWAGFDGLQLEVELTGQLRHLLAQLQHTEPIAPVRVPESFRGVLRPYQAQGVSWMLFLRRFGLGGCLADDMGLGKTIQWITYLLYVLEEEEPDTPSLLICPTSVIGNWQKELERFAPKLRVHLHYGPNRLKGDVFRELLGEADLVITSYALAHLDEEELCGIRWSSICLDEAQNIKNAYTKQSSSIRRLPADHRIAMTGTPMENRLTELWAIYDFINPGYLGSLRSFTERFVHPIERSKSRELIQQVRRFIQPFLLRRVKSDPAIELDLPEKFEYKTFVSLTVEQAALYETVVQELFSRMEQLTPMERRGLILSSLTKLKQICDHPALYMKDSRSARQAAKRSHKMARLLEMVKELRQEGDRCIVFTQFVDMGSMLQAFLSHELQEPVLFLHGGTPKAKRDEMIGRFQAAMLPAADVDDGALADRGPDGEAAGGVFILSLKAGGVGLNLTAANHVFHYDRWWNPAVETQATDRAFRIGQTKRVQVHKFVTLGTLEERIDEMIEGKLGLTREIVGSGEGWLTELSTGELKELFRLRKKWIDAQ